MDIGNVECTHDHIFFGSGDFYIFCEDCGRRWVVDGPEHNLSPIQSFLSGERRVRIVQGK